MLDRPGCDLAEPWLALGGSTAVLIELPRTPVPADRVTAEISRLVADGVRPVIAHPERYPRCTADSVRAWRGAGAAIQSDTTMLLAAGPARELGVALLARGLVDCLASDNHGDARTLRTARDWLAEVGGQEQAELLTRINPAYLLASRPPEPVPPLKLDRKLVDRLRAIVASARAGR